MAITRQHEAALSALASGTPEEIVRAVGELREAGGLDDPAMLGRVVAALTARIRIDAAAGELDPRLRELAHELVVDLREQIGTGGVEPGDPDREWALDGRFRMPVEDVFSIEGRGTVAKDRRLDLPPGSRERSARPRMAEPEMAESMPEMPESMAESMPEMAESMPEAPEPMPETAESMPDVAAAEPTAATRDAWPRLDAPGSVVAGTTFTITVGLREHRDVDIVAPMGPVSLPANSTTVLDVAVLADGFGLVSPSWQVQLTVTPDTPFPTETVQLVAVADPTLRPQRSIGVTFASGGVVKGIATRQLTVVEHESELPADPPGPAPAEISPPTSASPDPASRMRLLPEADGAGAGLAAQDLDADLTITISRGDDLAGHHLIWDVWSPRVELPEPPVDNQQRRSTLGSQPREMLADIVRHGNSVTDPLQLLTWLEGRGRKIAAEMPAFVLDAIAQVTQAAGGPPAILLMSQEPYVPWELALLEQPTGGRAFLGVTAAVGRWRYAEPPPSVELPDTTTAGDVGVLTAVYDGVQGWDRLTGAEAEAQDVRARFGATDVEPVFAEVLSCIRGTPPLDLLHVALHGRFQPADARSGLVLLADHPSVAGEVVESFFEPDHVATGQLDRRPLVFLNACQVGAADEVLGDPAGLALEFVGIGAAAVVAPLWNVVDRAARAAADHFYEATLTGGVPCAEVLRRRRAAAVAAVKDGTSLALPVAAAPDEEQPPPPDDPAAPPSVTDLSYLFYGAPTHRLAHAEDDR